MATSWPICSSLSASSLPTRPQPTTTTCTEPPCHRRSEAADRTSTAITCAKRVTIGAGWVSCALTTTGRVGRCPSRRPEPRDLTRVFSFLKRIFVGRPLASSEQEHQRLIKTIALAVFSSDAISSTAYATQEILLVIALAAGSSLTLGLSKLVPIAIAVIVLLVLVVSSYRQTIFAYPSGGGSYVVSRENLGDKAAMVAGASLLVDYILTVAVSVCAGVRAITSIPALQGLTDKRVLLCVAAIIIITLMNLRGVKESGRIFALPTYVYILVLSALIIVGLAKSFGLFGLHIDTILSQAEKGKFLSSGDLQSMQDMAIAGGSLALFQLLRGFASGAVALTGVEAISNGVPAF